MTEVAMHPLSTIPSEELDEYDVPFKIINQDNLPITIIGESIFKPFGNDYQKIKPNGIVYPTRRIVSNLQENKQKGFTKSHGHVNFYEIENLNKDYSISHGNLNHCNSAAKNRSESTKLNPSFTKILDAKLRKLQKEEKITKIKPETPRKPFITTVKTGHFLEPPPETASLFGFKVEQTVVRENKDLYAYASKPRVLHKYSESSHQSRCETAAKAAASISSTVIGLNQFVETFNKDINSNTTRKFKDVSLPYANLMVDRRSRGFNNSNQHTQTQRKWNPNFAYAKLLSVDKQKQEESENRAAEAHRRATARRKAQKQQFRGSKLSLGTPSPRRKFENQQADLYLREILKNPPVVDAHMQTDLDDIQLILPNRNGFNVETQIYPGDLFDFDEEVEPILEVLVGKTIEQALIEVLDEEELASLRLQQRRYLERRATEEDEQQQQLRLQEANKEDSLKLKEEVHLVNGVKKNNYGPDVILLQGYVDELLPNVLDGLKKEGLTIDSVKHENNESFMPWLTKEVTNELHEMIRNPDILVDIVREILENRAEIYKVLQQGSQEESADECPTNENIVIEDLNLKNDILKISETGNGITTIS